MPTHSTDSNTAALMSVAISMLSVILTARSILPPWKTRDTRYALSNGDMIASTPPSPNSHCHAMHDAAVTGTATAMFEHTSAMSPTVMIVVMLIDSAFTVLYSALIRSHTMHAIPTIANSDEKATTTAISTVYVYSSYFVAQPS